MAKKRDEGLDKQTELAQKRTEMAYERTVLAYLRTSATIILFGIAFLGFTKEKGFLFYAGIVSIVIGVSLGIIALDRTFKHSREIKLIKYYFVEKIIRKRNNKKDDS